MHSARSRRGRRGAGGIIAAVIIVLLLLLSIAAFYQHQRLTSRQAQVEQLRLARQTLEARVLLNVRAGTVGSATAANATLGLYNGLDMPLRIRAIVLVTSDGRVGLITGRGKPPFVTAASAALYRVVGGSLELVREYPDLVQAIASGELVVPGGHLLQVSIISSETLDLLRARFGLDAPLASAATSAAVPVAVRVVGVYSRLADIALGTPAAGGAPYPPGPGGGCVLPIDVENRVNESLTGYPVLIVLNSSNFDDWESLRAGEIYFTLEDDTPLHYYVELLDTGTRLARIWVRVNLSGLSAVRVLMHYNGPNSYPSYAGPEGVFTYYNRGDRLDFDWYPYDTVADRLWGDFDGVDPNAWSLTDSGIESTVTIQSTHLMAVKNLSLSSACVEAEVNLEGLEEIEEAGIVARVHYDPQTGELSRVILRVIYYPSAGRTGFELLAQHLGSTTASNSTYLPGLDANAWYRIRLCTYGDRAYATIETPNDRTYTLAIRDPQSPPQGIPGGAGLHSAYTQSTTHLYRDIIVRPYVSPEPLVSVGVPTCYQPPPSTTTTTPGGGGGGGAPPSEAPWVCGSRFRMPLTFTSPHMRSEWPVAVRLDFGELGAPGIVDPRTIYVTTASGSLLPLNLTEVAPNIYWLVFPANLTSTGSTYYVYFDTQYKLQCRPPPYPVGLARPVSGSPEEAHTNLDYETLLYGSGWGGNRYILLAMPHGYLEPPPSGGTLAGPGLVSLGFQVDYYGQVLSQVNLTGNMALLAPGAAGSPGAGGIASTPVIAALWGDVGANETRVEYTYSQHGGRLFRVSWSHVEYQMPPGWLEGWEYRLPITVEWTGAETLNSLVVLVNVSGVSSLYQNSKPDGSDLRFALPDGTLLQAYPLAWDPDREIGLFYVKIPSLPPGNSTIYLYYGNPSASPYWSAPQDLGLRRGYNPQARNLETVNDWYPRKSDLYQNYWGDAGRDAFDGFGYPTLRYQGSNYNLPMGPGSRLPLEQWVNLGDFQVLVRVFFADDVEHNGISDDLVWAIEVIPDQHYSGQRVDLWLHGNLGSDGGTRSTSHSISVDGYSITYYVSNDESNIDYGTRWDPQIRYAGIAGLADDQGLLQYQRSGDNVYFFGFRNARLPLTLYLAVGDTGRERWEQWLQSSLGWVPPYIPSGGRLEVRLGRPGGWPASVAVAHASIYPSGDVLLQYGTVNLTWGHYSIGIGSGGQRWICAVSNIPGDSRPGVFDPGDPGWPARLQGVDLLFLNTGDLDLSMGPAEENQSAQPIVYYKPIVISVGQLEVDQVADYPVLVRVDTASLIAEGRLDPQLEHMAFYSQDGDPLPFYIIPGTEGTNDTWIYVLVPELPSGGQVTIYLIYGESVTHQDYTPEDLGLARGPLLDLHDPDHIPAHVHHLAEQDYDRVWVPSVSDLGCTSWGDAGRDAFDGWGYPRYSWGDTQSPSTSWGVMCPGSYHGPTSYGSDEAHLTRYADPVARSVSTSGGGWYAVALMPTGPVLEVVLLPDEAAASSELQFSFQMRGNLGSDGSTSGPYTFQATLRDGSTITFYMTNDDGRTGTGSDPRIWYVGVSGLPGEQGLFYIGRSGDNSWMGFHGARGPFTLMLIPADLNPQRLALWLHDEISWIPPFILSGGYTYTVGEEQSGVPWG